MDKTYGGYSIAELRRLHSLIQNIGIANDSAAVRGVIRIVPILLDTIEAQASRIAEFEKAAR